MLKVSNKQYLRNYPRPSEQIIKYEKEKNQLNNINILCSRIGLPTLQIEKDGKTQYVHSKYDPIKEAERLVDEYSKKYNNQEHIFFYGIGLGYHIEIFMKKHPNVPFTLYEPSIDIFYHYLCERDLDSLPVHNLKNIFIEDSEQDLEVNLYKFSRDLPGNILFIVLPSYEQIFKEKYTNFTRRLYSKISIEKLSLNTNLSFQNLWLLNSVKNFKEVLNTPNILHDINLEVFKGKPALLVAAGPSLEQEFEDIKYIKENGLAYIFAVGSANKALVNQGIYPDAVCTYDPQPRNVKVYEEIISNNIKEIPMIFGSSVGHKTVEEYPGPKLHMITTQDSISQHILRLSNGQEVKKINDATTISLVTLELLSYLGCNPIIFVGQNLAYLNNRHYSKGISYDDISVNLTEEKKKNIVMVDDVYGGKVASVAGWERNAQFISIYIDKLLEGIQVYNSTKGGQKIKGAPFKPLESIIQEILQHKVVVKDWYKATANYDKKYIKDKLIEIKADFDELENLFSSLNKLLNSIDSYLIKRNIRRIVKLFESFDKDFKKLGSNLVFKMLIAPSNRVQLDLLNKELNKLKAEEELFNKAKLLQQNYQRFLKNCESSLPFITMLYKEVLEIEII